MDIVVVAATELLSRFGAKTPNAEGNLMKRSDEVRDSHP
jgi:hypothetical protein